VCARFLLPLVSSGCHKKEPHIDYTATAWTSFRSLLPGTIFPSITLRSKRDGLLCYCELLYVSSCHSPFYYFIFFGGEIKIRDRYRKRKGNYILQLRTVWAGDCEGYVQDRGRFDSYFFISRPWFPHETTPNDPRPSSSSSSFRSCCYFEFIGKERRRRNPLDLFLWSL
jgi:hypothetical protein